MEPLLIAPALVAATVSVLMLWASAFLWNERSEQQRHTIGLMSAAGLVFSLGDAAGYLPVSTGVILWTGQLQFLAAGAWVCASIVRCGLKSGRMGALYWVPLVACSATSALALVPGTLIGGETKTITVGWLGAGSRIAVPTTAGVAFSVFLVCLLVGLLGESLRRWKRGEPEAAAMSISFFLLILGGINDTLLISETIPTIPLTSVGFAVQGTIAVAAMLRRDVASRRALVTLTHDLELKVATRSEELAQAREETARSEKLAALGRLSAGIAHEINNPAGVVLANLQFLARTFAGEQAAPEDIDEAITDALSATERIARIVRQLQDSGRFASGLEVKLGPVRAHDSAQQAIDLAAANCPPTVEVTNEVPDDIWVVAQQRLLQQSLLNLVLNAQLAAGTGGRRGKVRVAALQNGPRVSLQVQDDGPGVPGELRGSLFEPFFSTRAVGEGMGLGLTVARGLVQAQRGELKLGATGPTGTRFELSLDVAAAPPPPQPTPIPLPVRHRPQVLVIDDDPLVQRAVSRQLSTGYDVTAVGTVAEGLALIEAQPARFSAVLCDVVMPDGGGRTYLPEIRRRWPALEARTFFITGGTTSGTADAFYEANLERVLQKPLETRDLLAALAACIGSEPESAPAPGRDQNHAK